MSPITNPRRARRSPLPVSNHPLVTHVSNLPSTTHVANLPLMNPVASLLLTTPWHQFLPLPASNLRCWTREPRRRLSVSSRSSHCRASSPLCRSRASSPLYRYRVSSPLCRRRLLPESGHGIYVSYGGRRSGVEQAGASPGQLPRST